MQQSVKALLQELKGIQLAESYLKELKATKENYQERLKKLHQLSNNRLHLIDNLSKTSLLSTYMKLVGKHNAALEISKNYYLDLVLEQNELSKLIEKADFEINILSNKVKSSKQLKSKLKEQLRSKNVQLKSGKLIAIKRIIKQIEQQVILQKELEEAIKAGVELNNKFNAAIKFIANKSDHLYEQLDDEEKVFNFDLSKINKYQNYLVNIRHHLIKFEAEVQDVYHFLFKNRKSRSKVSAHFMDNFRSNLLLDLETNKSLKHSYSFLKSHKGRFMSLTKALRGDLKKVKAKIYQLEKEENELMDHL